MKRWFYIPVFIVGFMISCRNESMNPVTGKTFYEFPGDKLWAHRANSIAEADSMLHEYNGIELDVVFDNLSGSFDVRHDPEKPSSGLSLHDYFSSIKEVAGHYYWIDFKNLEPENADHAVDCMNTLLNEFRIKDHVIIESFMPELLMKFHDAAFYTCFWVPCPDHHYGDSAKIAGKIREWLRKGHFNAISGPFSGYPFFDKYFHDCNIHLWTNGLITEEDKKIIRDLSEKTNVKIILVDYKKNFLRNNAVK